MELEGQLAAKDARIAELEGHVRELFDAVLSRTFEISSKRSVASLPFEMRAIRDARKAHVERKDGHREFWAHLGGEAVRHVTVFRYPNERPVPMREQSVEQHSYSSRSQILDGGDIRIEWTRWSEDALSTVVAEARSGED